MDSKYGKGSGFESLLRFVNNGDLNAITRDNYLRFRMNGISIDEVRNFISKNSGISDIFDTMVNKYGYGTAINQLYHYANSGDLSFITSTGGARNLIQSFSLDDVKTFINIIN